VAPDTGMVTIQLGIVILFFGAGMGALVTRFQQRCSQKHLREQIEEEIVTAVSSAVHRGMRRSSRQLDN
jgi:hypothetical protein